MKNRIVIALILSISCGMSPSGLYGQSSVSPYTIFGIGEIETGNYGENTGMGGLGIGIRQINALNTSNPAALAGIMSKKFIFDGAVFGKVSWYTGQGKQVSTFAGNLRRMGFGFQATDRWKISAGIIPYSSVGYDIRKSTQMDGGTGTYETTFSGEGGWSRFYIGQAFLITPNLSVGVNLSYVFGTITHKEVSAYWASEQKSHGQKTFFDFGLQYDRKLNNKLYLTAGVVGGYRSGVSMYNTVLTYDYEGNVAQDKRTPSSKQYIPEFYGAGFSLTSRKVTFGMDYIFQGWSRIDSGSDAITYKNMSKLTAGFSYTPNRYDIRSYANRITYQLGASANDSYLAVSGKSGINYSLSGGMVFPLKRNANSVYFGAEYGRIAFPAKTRSSIRENYFKLTLGFSFKETWFEKLMYD